MAKKESKNMPWTRVFGIVRKIDMLFYLHFKFNPGAFTLKFLTLTPARVESAFLVSSGVCFLLIISPILYSFAGFCLMGEGSIVISAAGGINPLWRRLRRPRLKSSSEMGGGLSWKIEEQIGRFLRMQVTFLFFFVCVVWKTVRYRYTKLEGWQTPTHIFWPMDYNRFDLWEKFPRFLFIIWFLFVFTDARL